MKKILLIFLCFIIIYGCDYQKRYYKSYQDAKNDGIIGNWIPEDICPKIINIYEKHNLDTNKIWITFEYQKQNLDCILKWKRFNSDGKEKKLVINKLEEYQIHYRFKIPKKNDNLLVYIELDVYILIDLEDNRVYYLKLPL